MRALVLSLMVLVMDSSYVVAQETSSEETQLQVSGVFGESMVLQRGAKIPVWGWASAGAEVAVSLDDQVQVTVADELGRWSVHLDHLQPGPSRTLKIRQGAQVIALKDILVGEVWICSGQSNMEWPVKRARDAKRELADSEYPEVRLAEAGRRSSGEPRKEVDIRWRYASASTAANFSAICFFFGRELHKSLGVPVGLVDSTWGATPIEAWIPLDGYEGVSSLISILGDVKAANRKYREAAGATLPAFEHWAREARRAYDSGAPLPLPPAWPTHTLVGKRHPTALYNGMVHWLVPFAMRGVLWYQGEKNVFDRDRAAYTDKMRALVTGWREAWRQGDFPFYYVQIAPYDYKNRGPDSLPELREAQARALDLQNVGMVTTTDIGNVDDIHPKNKQEVARRLLGWALARTYQRPLPEHAYRGPSYSSHRVRSNGRLRIVFDRVGEGLRLRRGSRPRWFDLMDEDGQWHRALASISSADTVDVWSRRVRQPAGVRFAWHEEAVTILENSSGLPAEQFMVTE